MHERIWDSDFGGQAGKENAHAAVLKFSCWRGRSAPRPDEFWRCNVENATYGPPCAPNASPSSKRSARERGFDAISVVTDTETLTPPCGACRQLIWEFLRRRSRDPGDLKGKTEIFQMRELFPKPLIPRIYRKWEN